MKLSLNQILTLGLVFGVLVFSVIILNDGLNLKNFKIAMLFGGVGSIMFVYFYILVFLQKEKPGLHSQD